jgi:BNR/Asp-box repeat protein
VKARLALVAALVAAAAGCGGGEQAADPTSTPTPAASTPTPNPTIDAPAETPAPPGSAANAFIGSIAIDPEDGTLMLGTGLGLFRAAKGSTDAERVVGKLDGGTLSSNMVVRYGGPGDLLASGHPEGAGSLPENLGLIRSGDAGDTWASVSLMGEADFHILQAAGDRVVAVNVEETDVRVSGDGGKTFESRAAPAAPLDVVFDAKDPERMVVTTEQGVFSSADEGRSWRPRDGIPSEQLVWAAPDKLYRADPGGLIKISDDGGASWKDAGTVEMSVNELAVDGGGALYASVAGGEVRRSTDGGKSWKPYLKLK